MGKCTDKYWADWTSGSCLKDCCPGDADGECTVVPPPIDLYDSIEGCCVLGLNGVTFDFCTSRSVNNYTDLWIVDYGTESCGEFE